MNGSWRRSSEYRKRFGAFSPVLALLVAGPSYLSFPSNLSGQVVQGHLADARTGFAMNGANVTLRDSTGTVVARTESNYLGAFRITTPDPGRYSLLVEAIGYRSTESDSFEVREGEVTTIDLSLPPEPVELDSLAVEAERQRIIPSLERQGFYRRKEEGFGYFITPEEIETRNPRSYTDLFRDIPGFRVSHDGGISWGHKCFRANPQIWIDGILSSSTADLSQVASIDEIAAVEIFLGPASVPLQYGGIHGQCVMLIWTKG
jgi:hypothetical protein